MLTLEPDFDAQHEEAKLNESSEQDDQWLATIKEAAALTGLDYVHS
jgi:hypothetical protein